MEVEKDQLLIQALEERLEDLVSREPPVDYEM